MRCLYPCRRRLLDLPLGCRKACTPCLRRFLLGRFPETYETRDKKLLSSLLENRNLLSRACIYKCNSNQYYIRQNAFYGHPPDKSSLRELVNSCNCFLLVPKLLKRCTRKLGTETIASQIPLRRETRFKTVYRYHRVATVPKLISKRGRPSVRKSEKKKIQEP